MKFLSIIIPIYNMEKYLPECIHSLQKQNFNQEVEILLLDDGSTDASSAICDEIAKTDNHFRVLHQENHGVAATRNRGLDEATGKYIAWIDPDDYITDDWWQVLQPVLLKNPDLVYFDMKMLEDDKFTEIHYDKKSRVIEPDEWYTELANGNRIMSHLWSKIFLRTLFDQNGVRMRFNEQMSYCEDYQVLHKVTLPIKECVYLHDCLYVYRQLTTSIVHDTSKSLSNAWLGVKLSQERYDFYHQHGIHVSNFGILYAKLQFCINYRGNYSNDKILRQHYQKCVQDLHHYRFALLQAKNLRKGLKLRLLLLTTHLYFVVPILKKLRDILKN